MDRTVKSPGSDQPGEYREIAGIAGVALGVPALVEVAGAAMWTAPMYGGPHQSIPFRNPAGLAWELFSTHHLVWSPEAWAGLGTIALGTAAGVAGAVLGTSWLCGKCRELRTAHRASSQRAKASRSSRRAAAADTKPIDTQAQYLAQAAELEDLGWEAMCAKASRLGVRLGITDTPGVMIGESVVGARALYGSFEDLHLDIMGPRAGKSTSRVIPAVMEAIGPVIATSNKRDVVDATRQFRATRGRVWAFDPQGVADSAPTWFWDPIAWVLGEQGGSGAHRRARELAGHFAAGGDADRKDAFFDPEGENLLAGLFLAAALAKKPITDAFMWVTTPRVREPIQILDEHGYEMVAAALADQYGAPDKQRAGIFSTAKQMASCLMDEEIRAWVTPPRDGEAEREQFDVHAFATSQDTLYPLSKEGKGSAGPLITALTAAVVDAAARAGERRPGGRLPVPMLAVLDEAANIVKWADLPKMYSHFGSRGIVVMTVLQSWAQGTRCWGPEGMSALWSAANIRVLGPGLADAGFLRDVSELTGQHYEITSSVTKSKSPGNPSSSTSWSRTTETTLTPSDLASIPPGRALVMTSGHRPTLVRLIPWMARPYAEAVKASIAAHSAPTSTNDPGEGWTSPATDTEGE